MSKLQKTLIIISNLLIVLLSLLLFLFVSIKSTFEGNIKHSQLLKFHIEEVLLNIAKE